MNDKLTNLIFQTLTTKTPNWPWPTTENYHAIMGALAKLIKYELTRKHLLSVKPEILGKSYEAFDTFNSEAIFSLTVDFYAEKIASEAKYDENHPEHHKIIKWINNNPNQSIEPYLRNAISWFIYELQCKANEERCSIGIHVKHALKALSDQGVLELNPPSTFCFEHRTSNECASDIELRSALLKTAAWPEIQKTILQKDSKQADKSLTQSLSELTQYPISCFYQKDLIKVIFQQISSFQTQIDLDDTSESADDVIEYEIEKESAMQISIPLHDLLFDNSDQMIQFIENQTWNEKIKQKCITILQAIIHDEGDVGVQKRVSELLGIPPQSVNDCMRRLRSVDFKTILKM